MPGANADGFGAGRFATAGGATGPQTMAVPGSPEAAPMEIDAIRREGLTGRQLRMARRLAQKHGLPATSDFDAVRLLRARGVDPFQANAVLELVAGGDGAPPDGPSRALTITPGGDGIQLPQTIKPAQLPSTDLRAEEAHLAEVARIQRDIARRRRRKSALLTARLAVFVLLPTFLAGLYFYTIATPMYAAKTQFVIQQAEAPVPRRWGAVLLDPDGDGTGFDCGAGLSAKSGRHAATGRRQWLSRAFFRALDRCDPTPCPRRQRICGL
jgi:capsular polysaccharide transport system permease protein